MRKFLLALLALCVFINISVAQKTNADKGFYIKGGASYFLKVTPVEFPNVGTLQPRVTEGYLAFKDPANPASGYSEIITKDQTITGSFGQGFRAEIVPGYKFSKYLSVEMGIHYYKSAAKQMVGKYTADFYNSSTAINLYTEGDVTAFDIAPGLVLSLPLKGNFIPYTRVGVIVPVHGRLKISTDLYDKYGSTMGGTVNNVTLHREETIKPNPTIGFQCALGGNYTISKDKKWGVYAELEYRNIAVSSKNKEVEVYNGTAKKGGQDVTLSIDQLTTYQRYTDYENSINPSATHTSDEHSQELKSYINIGGLGATVGVRYNF